MHTLIAVHTFNFFVWREDLRMDVTYDHPNGVKLDSPGQAQRGPGIMSEHDAAACRAATPCVVPRQGTV
jgi:hypothetical protein